MHESMKPFNRVALKYPVEFKQGILKRVDYENNIVECENKGE